MAKRLQYRRLLMLALLLAIAFAGLGYRLVDIQVLRHDELSAKAQRNTRKEMFLKPRRGDIFDSKGNLLAGSDFAKTICADPPLMGNRQAEVARALAPLLQMNEQELLQRLLPRVLRVQNGVTNYSRYVVLKRRVPVETWNRIQATMTNLTFGVDEKRLSGTEQNFYRALRTKAIFAEDYPIRVYPNQSLAAHLLGYTATEEVEVNNTAISQIVGRDGIEFSLNSKLSGVCGWRLTEKDGRGREIVQLREQDVEPRDGLNVVLTIDSAIQSMVESALAEAMERHSPQSATAIVSRPRTGEILAIATLPTFDPNNPGAVSADARRNRVVTDVMEPGSTFKIVVVSAALNESLITLNDMFDCDQGKFFFAGRTLHDHHPYGVLSVKTIITKSSNIGSAKIGIRLGENRLYDYMRAFGFGSRSGLPFPTEAAGIVHPVKNWSKVSVAQIPMGHGVAVTRLQMQMAMAAIANNGVLMRPMLVSRLEDQKGNIVARYSPEPVRRVVSAEAARAMVEALKTVVSEEGTAPTAMLGHYTVAGKTGTAQKPVPGGYSRDKFITSFIGFFPADNPELCISVVLDEPKGGYYGGRVAGPIFKQIAEAAASYLNIRPDIEEKTPEIIVQSGGGRTAKYPMRAP